MPPARVPLIWQNKKRLFKLRFEASAETRLEVAADPKHLGAEIGFLSVLHTWGQTLQRHPHVPCVVPGGGLSRDHQRWIRSPSRFFLPVKVRRRAFRQKERAFHGPCLPLSNPKTFDAFLRTLFREEWVVYAKPPFGGPEHVLPSLARYTHRVAISNHRILDITDTHVTFRCKDYVHHKQRTMTLTQEEFLRRFLEHVLPKGFPRLRYFGFLANRRRGEFLPLCRTWLSAPPPPASVEQTAGTELWLCPSCQGPMRVVEFLTAEQIAQEKGRQVAIVDTSSTVPRSGEGTVPADTPAESVRLRQPFAVPRFFPISSAC